MTQSIATTSALPNPPRSVGEAMKRGALGRCPACGKGKLFQGYLKVADHCPDCGEAMRLRHRKRDNSPFWSCSNYPACRGTRPAEK